LNDLLVDSQSLCSYSVEQITLTTSDVVFITTFTEGLLPKASMSIRPPLIGSTAVTSPVAVTSDARSIQISSQKYSYTLLIAMQAAAVQ